jgi:hypothetical protein
MIDVGFSKTPVIFQQLSYKVASAYTAVQAGTYNIEVRESGTNHVLLAVDSVNLEDGLVYTFFAQGFLRGSGSQKLGLLMQWD